MTIVVRIVPVLAGLAFAAFLGYTGIPALRHDWSSWIAHGAFFSQAWSTVSGWRTDGFGSPRPYPTDYLLITANSAIYAIFGIYGTFLVDAFAIGYTVAAGAVRLAQRWSGGVAVCVCAALFALFNPWVYNEVVAGHIYMVLAYGALMLLASELLLECPMPFRVGAFLLLTMGQLQFFVPSALAVAVSTVARRSSPWPLVTAAVASLPIWVGLASESAYLHAIPYTLTWQEGASVDAWQALVLGGYFALYADALPWYGAAAVAGIAALSAIASTIALVRAPRPAAAALIAFFAVWAFVGGSKGVLSAAYPWIVRHVPATGLYRELYDGVAFLCVAYLVACSFLARRIPVTAWAWLACALALFASWIVEPPARYWVPASKLPPIAVNAPANTRYALLPPLQPIRYLWGSGLDPDAVILPQNVTPLNTLQLSYPESAALMRYDLARDARLLEALSVAEVVERPAYASDVVKLGDQLAVPPPAADAPAKSAELTPESELSLAPLPALSVIPQPLWENAVFFGDAAGVDGPGVPVEWRDAPAVTPIAPESPRVAASDGWVDARSAFVALPELSQGLGGAITTNPYALLHVDSAKWTLAFVDGRLESGDGSVIARTAPGYRWLPPVRDGVLRCRGTCIVVAQSPHPYRTREVPSETCSTVLTFTLPAPWLAVSTLPVSPRCLLRYNVRFDQHWNAWAGSTKLVHVAIDSSANGWIVPAHAAPQRLIVVEGIAGIQFVLEVLSVAVLLAIAVRYGYIALWSVRASS